MVLKHRFETRFWNTVLQKSVYKSFLPSVFLALSTVPLRIRHSAQLVPWQKVKQGARFSISIIVTSLCLRSLLRLYDFQNRVSTETLFLIAPFCAFQNSV